MVISDSESESDGVHCLDSESEDNVSQEVYYLIR